MMNKIVTYKNVFSYIKVEVKRLHGYKQYKQI